MAEPGGQQQAVGVLVGVGLPVGLAGPGKGFGLQRGVAQPRGRRVRPQPPTLVGRRLARARLGHAEFVRHRPRRRLGLRQQAQHVPLQQSRRREAALHLDRFCRVFQGRHEGRCRVAPLTAPAEHGRAQQRQANARHADQRQLGTGQIAQVHSAFRNGKAQCGRHLVRRARHLLVEPLPQRLPGRRAQVQVLLQALQQRVAQRGVHALEQGRHERRAQCLGQHFRGGDLAQEAGRRDAERVQAHAAVQNQSRKGHCLDVIAQVGPGRLGQRHGVVAAGAGPGLPGAGRALSRQQARQLRVAQGRWHVEADAVGVGHAAVRAQRPQRRIHIGRREIVALTCLALQRAQELEQPGLAARAAGQAKRIEDALRVGFFEHRLRLQGGRSSRCTQGAQVDHFAAPVDEGRRG